MKIIYLIFTLIFLISLKSYSQTWLQQAQRESKMTRIGLGVQALEPTSIIFQLYKGGFCSNDNTYANYFTTEVVIGFENILFKNEKTYKIGIWQNGGFQGGINVYYPLYTLPAPSFSAQLHIGAGLQGGSRKYEEQGQSKIDNILGGNLLLRFSLTGRGIEIKDRLWFISYFIDTKYHRQFGEDFFYFRPSVGLVFRKVR